MVGDRALYGGAGVFLNNIRVKITIMDLLDNSVETGHFTSFSNPSLKFYQG